MKSRTVEELLLELGLTKEEKKKHKELIQESLERQKRLLEYHQRGEEGVRALEIYLRSLSRSLLIMHQSVRQANDRLAGVIL
jgi:transcription initiation factor TFIIIB Brf1 subunit/transcription initiation factor TFIIB